MRALAPWLLLASSGCIFITQADRDAKQADGDDTTVFTDLGYGDDDDDDDDGVVVAGSFRGVSVSVNMTCAIDDGFELRCWDGEDEVDSWLPALPDDADVPLFDHVSLGVSVGCAWEEGGETRCFGRAAGTDLNPEPSIDSTPGSFDLVRCRADTCCGLTDVGGVECWGTDTLELFGDDTTGRNLVDLAGTGTRWCALDGDTEEFVCFATSTALFPPDIDWPSKSEAPTGLFDSVWGHVCAAADDTAYCWSSSGSGALDVRDLDDVASLQGYGNAQDANLCGLSGGTLACFAAAGRTPYQPPGFPAGNWAQLSMADGNGCVLDTDGGATCWGDGAHMPHNAP